MANGDILTKAREKLADFGNDILGLLDEYLLDGYLEIDIDDLLYKAEKHKLYKKVPFNSKIHSHLPGADTGSYIWIRKEKG